MNDYWKFQEFLMQKKLSATSIKEYCKVIKAILNRYGEDITIEEMNGYIRMKNKRRQNNVKYALKHYLEFKNRKKDYYELVAVIRQQKIRQENYLENYKIKDILEAIEDENHRLIARIQAISGKRIRAVLTIRVNNIKFNEEEIEIIVEEKGVGGAKKIEYIFLPKEMEDVLRAKIKKNKEYLFLPEGIKGLDEISRETRVDSVYKAYEKDIKYAGRKAGIENLTSHDFRKSLVNYMDNLGTMNDREKMLVTGHKTREAYEIYQKRIDARKYAKGVMLGRGKNL